MQCPFCRETIQEGAIKCRHCGSMLNQQQPFQQPFQQQSLNCATGRAQHNMLDWYMEVLKKYAVFTGRARRKEYWYFALLSAIVSIVLAIVGAIADIGSSLYYLYSFAVFLPGIAVGIRRMHDTNRSGWWFFLPIANLVFLFQDSQHEANEYGLNPKRG